MLGALQNGTSAPHESFRHQASCCHPRRRRAEAQVRAPQSAAQHLAAVRSHREAAYDWMRQAIQSAGVVQPDPSSLLLRPSANRSCRRPSDPLFRDPLRDARHRQTVDQVACQQHHPPADDRFQATDPIAGHQSPDCAAPDCAAAVENVIHPPTLTTTLLQPTLPLPTD